MDISTLEKPIFGSFSWIVYVDEKDLGGESDFRLQEI